jgi:hypothetical protein
MHNQNQIIEIRLRLDKTSRIWKVEVTKEFEEQYGGGEQTFTETAPHMHRALDTAREMVTVSPGQRTDIERGTPDATKL